MQNTMTKVLDKVNLPQDLRSLTIDEMASLSEEIRQLILKKVNATGGHLGPNLGIVEATVALHYVFNSPIDKFVFDVSHQCYPHKILTGRKEGFTNPDKYYKYTGYTAPEESAHDLFKIGHTSTSVSLATGLAKARDLNGGKENIIALIGDGSLTGGEALEGLNNAAVLGSNIIIVVNDNDMSIAENQGGIYDNLRLLRETKGSADLNFFKTLGFDYYYVENGNNVEDLISTFRKVKDVDHPVIVHIYTQKGKGWAQAEADKEAYHWIVPGALDEKIGQTSVQCESYESITTDFILRKARKDRSIVAITPATPGVSGFTPEFREKLGSQYVDVGIAEEHAVAFASGLAKNAARPILAVMSSFLQRTYDQLSQDLALNNTPAVILVYWGGITGMDATHLSSFDIPLVNSIPNLVHLSPVNKEEYLQMLEWATTQKEHPVMIRVPFTNVISTGVADVTDYSQISKYKVEEKGSRVAILGLGNFFYLGKKVKQALSESLGIDSTLINPRFSNGLDENLLSSLKNNHDVIITLEDGILDGGFGEKIARFYGNSDIKVLNFGAKKEFTDRVPLDRIYENNHLTVDLILEDIKKCL